jgi:hypothetical protein
MFPDVRSLVEELHAHVHDQVTCQEIIEDIENELYDRPGNYANDQLWSLKNLNSKTGRFRRHALSMAIERYYSRYNLVCQLQKSSSKKLFK